MAFVFLVNDAIKIIKNLIARQIYNWQVRPGVFINALCNNRCCFFGNFLGKSLARPGFKYYFTRLIRYSIHKNNPFYEDIINPFSTDNHICFLQPRRYTQRSSQQAL
jgi:hypothetical protein